jgi:hypothetical protein
VSFGCSGKVSGAGPDAAIGADAVGVEAAEADAADAVEAGEAADATDAGFAAEAETEAPDAAPTSAATAPPLTQQAATAAKHIAASRAHCSTRAVP